MIRVLEVNVDDLNFGGVFSLVRNVITHNDSEISIDIAAIEKFENEENIKFLKMHNCKVHYIGYEGNKWMKQIYIYKNLQKLLKYNNYDYVHIHADTANKLIVSAMAAKRAKVKKIILHSHSSGAEGNNKMKIIIHKLCSYRLKSVATVFVACSKVAGKWMYPNVPEEKIVMVKNGIPLNEFTFNKERRIQIRNTLQIEDDIVIGHVGRWMDPKNPEYLIKIIKAITDRGIPSKLLLIGEGYKEKVLKEMVKSYGLEDQVIFYGTSNQVNELLLAMDVFCLPSYFEGLPIVGIEAQATDLPVIFSDRITKEVKLIKDVEYIPIGDENIKDWVSAILRLTKGEKRDIRSNQIVRDAGFDISDTVKAFLNLYKFK